MMTKVLQSFYDLKILFGCVGRETECVCVCSLLCSSSPMKTKFPNAAPRFSGYNKIVLFSFNSAENFRFGKELA